MAKQNSVTALIHDYLFITEKGIEFIANVLNTVCLRIFVIFTRLQALSLR